MIYWRYHCVLLLSFLFITNRSLVSADSPSLEEVLPGLRDRAIVMDIATRIVEHNQQVVWNSEDSRVTISGRPVGIKLVGDNIVVAVQFTPYFRTRGNNILVAQGQVWVEVPNHGMSYHTSIQTIPMEFGEVIYFFPLGSSDSHEDAQIEIQLILRPYNSGSSEIQQRNTSPR